MKKLILVVALALSAVASAAEIQLVDIENGKFKSASGEFIVNEELNRVWVEVSVKDVAITTEGDMPIPDYYQKQVEGLSYDASSKKIILTVDGQDIECAVVKERGVSVFRHKYVKNTGCAFKSKLVSVEHDNGFEIKTRRHLQYFLVTK